MNHLKHASGLSIFPVCLGTMGFSLHPDPSRAWAVNYDTSKSIIKEAIDHSMNFFDTAPVYSNGASEEALGQALCELNIPRENIVIATKFYPRSPKEIEQGVGMKEHIRKWLEGSLTRLQTDYVDIFYLHMWDWHTPVEETIRALDELVREGKIRALGLSNAYAWQIAMANEKAIAMNCTPFSFLQNQWNLISREDETELRDCLAHYHMTAVPYASLAAGRLARPLGTQTARSRLDAYGERKFSTQKAADAQVIETLEAISKELNEPMSSVALAWLIAKGAIPLAGATRPEQIEGLAKAAEIKLSDEIAARLEEHYVPHVITGVLAEHTANQDAYEAYGVYGMDAVMD